MNQDLAAQRLVKAVASVHTREMRSAPHRARGDAAVEELAVQIIKEPFENGSSPMSRHSPDTNEAGRRSEQGFLLAIRLSTLGPVFLHSPADLSLLGGRHRLTTSHWPRCGRSSGRRAATQPGKRAIDRRELLGQFGDAGFGTASRIFLQIKSCQRSLQNRGETAFDTIRD